VPDHAATAAHSARGTHAVVVGAGPAGVAAALALAARTERITLVDRADVPGPEWEARPRPADVRAVLESPQVVVRAGLEVVGLVVRDDGGEARVGGVLVRSRRAGGAVTEIGADLVVDARGPVPVPVSVAATPARRGRGRNGPRPSGGSVATSWPAQAG
jgi:NADPH-dependent 2,4-dienoyl-CoA reductase/sulfur reductase-like enzyme